MNVDVTSQRKPTAEDDRQGPITLTILISSYNTRQLLEDCLCSIYRNPPSRPYEIIVVDDASRDGTSEMVRTGFPDVRLIRNEVNHHYAYSNNRGIERARGDYVLLLNSDTIVLADAFDGMVEFLEKNPQAGVVGCKLLNEDGSIQWSVKSLPNPGSALFGARSFLTRLFPHNRWSRQHLLHLDRDMTKPFLAEDGYVSSAASMMPRSVMRKVGLLDPEFAYHVDADYCKRTADAGYPVYYLPTATIIHLNHRGGTMASPLVRIRSILLFERQSFRYYRKHFRRSRWSPMQLLVVAGLSCHFIALASEQLGIELATFARALFAPEQATSGTASMKKEF